MIKVDIAHATGLLLTAAIKERVSNVLRAAEQ